MPLIKPIRPLEASLNAEKVLEKYAEATQGLNDYSLKASNDKKWTIEIFQEDAFRGPLFSRKQTFKNSMQKQMYEAEINAQNQALMKREESSFYKKLLTFNTSLWDKFNRHLNTKYGPLSKDKAQLDLLGDDIEVVKSRIQSEEDNEQNERNLRVVEGLRQINSRVYQQELSQLTVKFQDKLGTLDQEQQMLQQERDKLQQQKKDFEKQIEDLGSKKQNLQQESQQLDTEKQAFAKQKEAFAQEIQKFEETKQLHQQDIKKQQQNLQMFRQKVKEKSRQLQIDREKFQAQMQQGHYITPHAENWHERQNFQQAVIPNQNGYSMDHDTYLQTQNQPIYQKPGVQFQYIPNYRRQIGKNANDSDNVVEQRQGIITTREQATLERQSQISSDFISDSEYSTDMEMQFQQNFKQFNFETKSQARERRELRKQSHRFHTLPTPFQNAGHQNQPYTHTSPFPNLHQQNPVPFQIQGSQNQAYVSGQQAHQAYQQQFGNQNPYIPQQQNLYNHQPPFQLSPLNKKQQNPITQKVPLVPPGFSLSNLKPRNQPPINQGSTAVPQIAPIHNQNDNNSIQTPFQIYSQNKVQINQGQHNLEANLPDQLYDFDEEAQILGGVQYNLSDVKSNQQAQERDHKSHNGEQYWQIVQQSTRGSLQSNHFAVPQNTEELRRVQAERRKFEDKHTESWSTVESNIDKNALWRGSIAGPFRSKRNSQASHAHLRQSQSQGQIISDSTQQIFGSTYHGGNTENQVEANSSSQCVGNGGSLEKLQQLDQRQSEGWEEISYMETETDVKIKAAQYEMESKLNEQVRNLQNQIDELTGDSMRQFGKIEKVIYIQNVLGTTYQKNGLHGTQSIEIVSTKEQLEQQTLRMGLTQIFGESLKKKKSD